MVAERLQVVGLEDIIGSNAEKARVLCWAAATGGSTANCWASYMRTGAKGTARKANPPLVHLGQLGDVESVQD